MIHIELTLLFCFPFHPPLSSTSDFNSLHSLSTDETWEKLLDRNAQIQLIIKFGMSLLRSPAFYLKEDEIQIPTERKFFKRCQTFVCVCLDLSFSHLQRPADAWPKTQPLNSTRSDMPNELWNEAQPRSFTSHELSPSPLQHCYSSFHIHCKQRILHKSNTKILNLTNDDKL